MATEDELKKADNCENVKLIPDAERDRGVSIVRKYFPDKMNSFSPSEQESELLNHKLCLVYSLTAQTELQNLITGKPVDFSLLNGSLDRLFEVSYWKPLREEMPSRRTEVFEYLLIAAYLDRIDEFLLWSEKNKSSISELELDTAFPWDDYVMQTILTCWGSMILTPSDESYNKVIKSIAHLRDIQSICEPDYLVNQNIWGAIHIIAHYYLAKATELFAQYQQSGDPDIPPKLKKFLTFSSNCFDRYGFYDFGQLMITYYLNLYCNKIFSGTNI